MAQSEPAHRFESDRPWLIHRPALETLLSRPTPTDLMAARHAQNGARPPMPAAMKTRPGTRMDGLSFDGDRRGGYLRGSVGVLEIHGPIYQRMTVYTDFLVWAFGGRFTASIAQDITVMAESPDVQAIVLDIDSPGGEAMGIAEVAALIRDAARKKPMVAYCSGLMCSAAYWLGSAAGEVVTDSAGILGSIGVVLLLHDTKGFQEKVGIKEIPIVSKQSPHKWPDPTTADGRREYEREVNSLATVFIADVARNRRKTPQQVMEDFGGGGVLIGQEAVKVGLADRVGSLEGVIREMGGGLPGSSDRGSTAAAARRRSGPGGIRMPKLMTVEGLARALGLKSDREAIAIVDDDTSGDEPHDAGASDSGAAIATLPRLRLRGQAPAASVSEPAEDPAIQALRDELKAEREAREKERQEREAERKAAVRAAAEQRIQAGARAFGEKVTADRKAFGKLAATLTALHERLALDDLDHPLSAAEGQPPPTSRVAALEGLVAALPTQTLGEQIAVSELPDGAAALGNRTGGNPAGPLTAEKYREIIGKTDAGRALMADPVKFQAAFEEAKRLWNPAS